MLAPIGILPGVLVLRIKTWYHLKFNFNDLNCCTSLGGNAGLTNKFPVFQAKTIENSKACISKCRLSSGPSFYLDNSVY